MPVAPLLTNAPLFRSVCPEETRGFLAAKDHLFAPSRPADGLDACLNGLYLPGLYIGFLSYGDAAVSAASGPSHTEYWLQLPVEGALAARSGPCELAADPDMGLLVAPSQRPWRFETQPGSARLQLALDRAAMVRRLEALLGDAATAPLEFTPTIDLTRGCGRTVARCLMLAIRDLERPDSAFADPATLFAFEEFVMTALLMGQPHSHGEALARLDRRLAPRDVKRADAFISENLHLPIGIADIAAAAGVPGRTLFKHFRDFKGVSPMRHLRDARLARAREALRSPRSGDNVTAIAAACGLAHLGRFSTDYRRVYGESPSQTLAAARSRTTSVSSRPH